MWWMLYCSSAPGVGQYEVVHSLEYLEAKVPGNGVSIPLQPRDLEQNPRAHLRTQPLV